MKPIDLRFVDVETCERLSTEKYGPAPENKPHALRPAMATVAMVTVGRMSDEALTVLSMTLVNCEAFGLPRIEDRDRDTVYCPDEAGLFSTLFHYINGYPLVTFNGRRFDVPVLTLGFARHSLKIPRSLAEAFKESKYKPKMNLDIFDRLTGFNATSASLSEFSRAFGIEDPKAHGGGGMFEDLCNPEGLEAAIRYNRGDVVATFELWKKWTAAQ